MKRTRAEHFAIDWQAIAAMEHKWAESAREHGNDAASAAHADSRAEACKRQMELRGIDP